MRRMLLLLPLLSLLAACSRYEGPRAVYQKNRGGDTADRRDAKGNPLYTIPEQERRGRERLSQIEDDWSVGPRTYSDRPDPIGRSGGVYGRP